MSSAPNVGSLKERFGALRNLPPFLAMVWQTSPALTAASLALRLVRALLPVATLYVGKLIIDEVVLLAADAGPAGDASRDWLASGAARPARLCCSSPSSRWPCCPTCSAASSRCSTALLSERFTNATSVRLMEHAATLDLEDFEDSELQDQLERARRQTIGPHDPDEPAVRPGAGRGHRRRASPPACWSTRRG